MGRPTRPFRSGRGLPGRPVVRPWRFSAILRAEVSIPHKHLNDSKMARRRKFNTDVPATVRSNLLGRKFGRLTVVGFGGYKPYGGKRPWRAILWTCRCECGSVCDYHAGNLRQGQSTQCAECGRKQANISRRKHGKSNSPAYEVWRRARSSGSLCSKWMQFNTFLRDMGDRPDGKSLRRKNTSRLHSPKNSYWGERLKTPPRNLYTHDGRTMGLNAWARELGISKQTLSHRLAAGWPVEDALTTPLGTYRGRSARRKRTGNRKPDATE